MCVIIVNSKKSEPLKEELLSLAWLANPHGGGLMYSKNDRLHTVKRMRLPSFIEEYYKAKREADSDVVLHFISIRSYTITWLLCTMEYYL